MPHHILRLLLLSSASFAGAVAYAAQESKPSSIELPAWPKICQQISFGSAGGGVSHGQFHVLEDGVEQTDAKIAEDTRSASVLLMIDVSTSMKSDLRGIVEAARKLIASAKPDDEFEIVTFSWPTYVEQAFTTDRGKLDDALTNVKSADGSTALFDAIDASIKEISHAHGSTKRAMVLFSDCVDSSSTSSSDKSLTRTLKTLEAPSMYIVCTAPRAKHAVETANRLSIASGGMTFASDQPDSLEVKALKIAQIIDGLGSMQYTTTHNKPDGKPHKIQVRYEPAPVASKIEMVYRQEYYAPSQ